MTWTISATHAVRMTCESDGCSFLIKCKRRWRYVQVILNASDTPTECIHCRSRNIKLEAIGNGKELTKIA